MTLKNIANNNMQIKMKKYLQRIIKLIMMFKYHLGININ